MKKKISWILFGAFVLTVAYLATLSDAPLNESEKWVKINDYISKQEMSADLDTLAHTFEKIHPNPYRFKSKNQFASSLDSIKNNLPDSLNTLQFWRRLDQIVNLYRDAHSNATDYYLLNDYVKTGGLFFPLAAKVQEDKIVIEKNDDFEQLLPEGAEIQKINGVGSRELISELLSHSAKETRQLDVLEVSDDFGFYLWKTYDWDEQFKIHYLKNSQSEKLDSMTLKGIEWEQRSNIAKWDEASFSFSFLEDSVAYMKITDFNGGPDEINDFYLESFNRIKDKKADYLILDFRGHVGGADSYGEDLAKYFANKPFRKLSKAYWKITPEFKEAFDRRFIPKAIRWFEPIYLVNEYSAIFYGAETNEMVSVNYELKVPLPKEERFQGEVFLITDHNTFSAGSIFAEMFSYYDMGLIVGEPTGNLCSFNGFALANFILPNSKLAYQVSSVYNIANNEEEGLKSVQPHYLVDPSEDPLKYIMDHLVRM